MSLWFDLHQYYMEPDDPPAPRQPRCPCGALLSWQPNMTVERSLPLDWHYTYDGEGNITSYVVLKEKIEVEDVWCCKRCQREHEYEDIF